MSFEQTSSKPEHPMRIILPDLYNELTEKLDEHHNIHQYDIQARVLEDHSGFEAIIYFGDGFTHKESHYFSNEAIENSYDGLPEFTEKIGTACKEVMIADYYKMMRPK
ncbi:hypothetical protein [Lentibacillus salicampi]|uniref:Uncharacterized protein n=1 Tax=Lentibacillus salicampi TaxID=175306 RepID=A0A4Y9AHI3_9BACI|nr:hypothetical protein [Lentibacillus salicampi]TFJ93864.1 hypothetical protein E4U82_05765 [Lentibacillus salicampi]